MLKRALVVVLALLLPFNAVASRYVVRPGDTLFSIATRHHVSLRQLAAANRLSNVNLVRVGEVLVIPVGGSVRHSTGHRSGRPGRATYRVRWGDTLVGISLRFAVPIATLRVLNPTLGAYPLAGERLRLCSSCDRRTATTHGARGPAGSGTRYLVRSGDSLSSISARFGVAVMALMQANRLLSASLVRLGQTLVIPGVTRTVSSAVYRPRYAYDPALVRSLIASYAQYYGLDVALALAIGWQESGYNQNVVSATGAIGVMQLEPYTARHIGSLWGRRVNPYYLRDNVAAGVYWIAQLVRYYGGNERLAVAAYYEGAWALDHRGFLNGTRRYVRSVMSIRAHYL